MNELLLLGSLSFQLFYSWKQYHFFLFPKRKKIKNTSQPSFWSPSFKSGGPWITTSIHTHACSPVVMTTHMWAPNKLLCRVLWRPKHTSECTALPQIHTHTKNPHIKRHISEENTGRQSSAACPLTSHPQVRFRGARRFSDKIRSRQYFIFVQLFPNTQKQLKDMGTSEVEFI